jgi:maltose alpha-D-glucosyltransferase/alpha-amylase
MLEARSHHPQLALGSYEAVQVSNPAVYVYVRGPAEGGENPILCVANLSRQAQPVEVPLRQYDGRTPVELLGKVAFPRIGELTYLLTLPPHGFFWFELVWQ